MAQLPEYENPSYPDVYELAVDDPVAGGPDGVDNLPHKQLKERTDYLKSELTGTQDNVEGVADRVLSLEASSAGSVGRAVPLSWEYGDRGFDFELFSAGFEWRDMEPVNVVQTVSGDESVDVTSTDNLEAGGTYVIYTGTGRAHTVRVDAVLSPVRFRATDLLTVSLSDAKMARTSWKIHAGYATAADGAIFYSRPLKALRFYEDGRAIIRRADTDGSLDVSYRAAGDTGEWLPAILERTASRESGTRDEEWRIVGGSDIELRITATHGESGEDIKVHHMVAFPGEQAGRAFDVARPVNQSPADEATDQPDTVTLEGSDYRSLYGVSQADAEFRVGTELDMSNVVYTKLTGTATTSHQVETGNLETDRVYFWQARYQDAEGTWSPWSQPTAFATGSVFNYVKQPINTSPASGSTSASVTARLQAGNFAAVGSEDTHKASQWQVATDKAFADIIHDTGETMTDLTSHKVPAGTLDDQQKYYFRVRYKGETLGESPYSKPTAFTTQAVPSAPSINAPADSATGVGLTPTITTSGFFIPGGDSHSASQYQVATDSAFDSIVYDSGETSQLTSIDVPSSSRLTPDTGYYVRARHKGATTGWGDWSSATGFRTFEQYITTPSVTSPSDNATDVPESPVITSSSFATSPTGRDSHAASSWRLYDSGNSVVWSSLNDSQNKTSITVPAGVMSEATTYQVEVVHHGDSLPDSTASPKISFTTEDTFVPEGQPGTPFGGGYFTETMYTGDGGTGQRYALVVSPKAEGDPGGTKDWQPAKDFCESLTAGGHSDWKLPTLDEARALYRKFKPTTQSNSTSYGASDKVDPSVGNYTSGDPSKTSIDKFKDGNSEAFVDRNHWTETESGSDAWRVNFTNGIETTYSKTSSRYVRAVRRVYF